MKIQLSHKFEDIVSLENLLEAWQEFVNGKRNKKDVQECSLRLMDNILALHNDLSNGLYQHGGYQEFKICDPKPRDIHKASVRDRLLHHAVHRTLYPFFDRTFIADSFSCRIDKGTHKAINRFRSLAYKVSRNNTRTCWILKCDIKKFFANIDQKILLEILKGYVPDQKIIQLLSEIIYSFSITPGRGVPLGNLTSQLFVNIYMNEFDQFVKHNIKARYYIRYADDFVLFSRDSEWLTAQIPRLREFLQRRLHLTLHPQKIFFNPLASGMDYLGWTHFSRYRALRTTTKRRMMRRIKESAKEETFQSYLGLLSHGNTFRLQQELLNNYWLWKSDD